MQMIYGSFWNQSQMYQVVKQQVNRKPLKDSFILFAKLTYGFIVKGKKPT